MEFCLPPYVSWPKVGVVWSVSIHSDKFSGSFYGVIYFPEFDGSPFSVDLIASVFRDVEVRSARFVSRAEPSHSDRFCKT